ncbi:hypothetical protein B0H11DRAFT_2233408 [Mycena galericulata]|nr:hypothetical protein B0H11DRAFT_2233408 [Mycena galericulata]
MKDPPALREAKAYAQNLHVENLINKIVVATPPWQVSDDLNKNIYSYAAAILLSVKLSAYKGSIPKNILFAILKKHRFDLPSGIEHNPANRSRRLCKKHSLSYDPSSRNRVYVGSPGPAGDPAGDRW